MTCCKSRHTNELNESNIIDSTKNANQESFTEKKVTIIRFSDTTKDDMSIHTVVNNNRCYSLKTGHHYVTHDEEDLNLTKNSMNNFKNIHIQNNNSFLSSIEVDKDKTELNIHQLLINESQNMEKTKYEDTSQSIQENNPKHLKFNKYLSDTFDNREEGISDNIDEESKKYKSNISVSPLINSNEKKIINFNNDVISSKNREIFLRAKNLFWK